MRRLSIIALAVAVGCFADAEPADHSTATDTTDTGEADTTADSAPDDTTEDTTATTGSAATSDASSSTTDAGVPAPDLWYRFDGNVRDQAGTADGVPVGPFQYAPGYDGMAGVFGPGKGYVRADAFGAEYRQALDAMTVAVRYRPDEYVGSHHLLCLGDDGETTATNAFNLTMRYELFEVFTEIDAAGTNSRAFLGPLPELGMWHRAVFVVDSGTVTLYLDGAEHATAGYVAAQTTSEALWVGAFYPSDDRMVGLIDDLQVFTRVLGDDEARALSEL